MKTTETIRDFNGRILGYIETDSITNDQIGRDFYNVIVGYYDAKQKVTRDFYRRIVGRGNILASLIMRAAEENERKRTLKNNK